MSELADLERRIVDALQRIDSGLERLGPLAVEPPDPEPDPALVEALEAEKVANAQLEERVRALRQSNEVQARELEARIATLEDEARERSALIRDLRQTNEQMRTALDKLREANAEGVSEPHLINQAMASEIQGLRQARDADRNELDTILASLKPLLKDRADA